MFFAGVGDCLITRKLSETDRENAENIRQIVCPPGQEVAMVANLEITLQEVVNGSPKGTPGAISGGFHVATTPDRLDDLTAFGINLFGFANNHVLDYNEGGMAATIDALQERNLVFSGAGADLEGATKAGVLQTAGGKVAMISVVSSLHRTWRAGKPRQNPPAAPGEPAVLVKGRAGANPLRHWKKLSLSPAHFTAMKEIADATEENDFTQMMVEQGFASPYPKDQILPFGTDMYGYNMVYVKGEQTKMSTLADPADLARIGEEIAKAKEGGAFVLINLHGHEMARRPDHIPNKAPFDDQKIYPADFLVEAAHTFIDQGADAIIGHGCHVLRGVEIYKGKPIFHSLGNFVFQPETMDYLPQEFFDENKVDNNFSIPQAMDYLQEADHQTHKPNPFWHGNDELVMNNVFATWQMDEHKKLTAVRLYPIDLKTSPATPRTENGFPELSNKHKPLERILAISKALYGVDMQIKTGQLADGKPYDYAELIL